MFDYYGMPENTPRIDRKDPDIFKRITKIEDAIAVDIGQSNCLFHLMLHEFEALLFSNPQSFSAIVEERIVQKIQQIRDQYPTPEHINNSVETAPSKRLQKLIPDYAKIKHGTCLAQDMGMDQMMNACPHFRAWIKKIIKMVNS